MSIETRKLIVLAVVAWIVLLANAGLIVGCLEECGIVEFAEHVRSEFLTGTALTVIFFFVFFGRRAEQRSWRLRKCRVCDHLLLRTGKYCGTCGSRV